MCRKKGSCRCISKRGGSIKSRVTNALGRAKNNVTSKIGKVKTKFNKKLLANAKKKPGKGKKGFDIHSGLLKTFGRFFPKGMTPGNYKYLGPGNPLERQIVRGRNGKIKKYIQKPLNKLDAIASKHDNCYANGKHTKNNCDMQMLKHMRNAKKKGEVPKAMKPFVQALIAGKLRLGV